MTLQALWFAVQPNFPKVIKSLGFVSRKMSSVLAVVLGEDTGIN